MYKVAIALSISAFLIAFVTLVITIQRNTLIEELVSKLESVEDKPVSIKNNTCIEAKSSQDDINHIKQKIEILESQLKKYDFSGKTRYEGPADMINSLKQLSQSRISWKLKKLIYEGDIKTIVDLLRTGQNKVYQGGIIINNSSVEIPPTLRIALLDALNKIGDEQSLNELVNVMKESTDLEEIDYCLLFLEREDYNHFVKEAKIEKIRHVLKTTGYEKLRDTEARNFFNACGEYNIFEAIPYMIRFVRENVRISEVEHALLYYPDDT